LKKHRIEKLAAHKPPRKQSTSCSLEQSDNRLIDSIAERLHCTRSDVVRRCIRLVATDMGFDQNG
jgi:hypothetical protein